MVNLSETTKVVVSVRSILGPRVDMASSSYIVLARWKGCSNLELGGKLFDSLSHPLGIHVDDAHRCALVARPSRANGRCEYV